MQITENLLYLFIIIVGINASAIIIVALFLWYIVKNY